MKKIKIDAEELFEAEIFGREATADVTEVAADPPEKKEAPAEEPAPKEEAPAEPAPPAEEAPAEPAEDAEPPATIEDTVGEWQDKVAEAYAEVKSFKPGRAEALTFRNLVQTLSDTALQAAAEIDKYYQKQLGGGETAPAE